MIYIDQLLESCFINTIREYFYDDSLNTPREITVTRGGSTTPLVPLGTTKYTKSYDNSGIFTYKSNSGIWTNIANATISFLISSTAQCGDILSWVYSVCSGYTPNKQKEAKVKTMYSYRYIEEKGWVYYLDWLYDYYPRATVVSRETCEHYWGQYIDINGYARQATKDLGVKKFDNAPHKGQSTWIQSKAKERWLNGMPHYYEDWT